MESSACHFSTMVGIVAFLASIGFIVGEWYSFQFFFFISLLCSMGKAFFQAQHLKYDAYFHCYVKANIVRLGWECDIKMPTQWCSNTHKKEDNDPNPISYPTQCKRVAFSSAFFQRFCAFFTSQVLWANVLNQDSKALRHFRHGIFRLVGFLLFHLLYIHVRGLEQDRGRQIYIRQFEHHRRHILCLPLHFCLGINF